MDRHTVSIIEKKCMRAKCQASYHIFAHNVPRPQEVTARIHWLFAWAGIRNRRPSVFRAGCTRHVRTVDAFRRNRPDHRPATFMIMSAKQSLPRMTVSRAVVAELLVEPLCTYHTWGASMKCICSQSPCRKWGPCSGSSTLPQQSRLVEALATGTARAA